MVLRALPGFQHQLGRKGGLPMSSPRLRHLTNSCAPNEPEKKYTLPNGLADNLEEVSNLSEP